MTIFLNIKLSNPNFVSKLLTYFLNQEIIEYIISLSSFILSFSNRLNKGFY